MTNTPGPWTAENSGKGSWIKGSNGKWAALSCGETDAEADDNAALISAAPEMLEALELALYHAAHYPEHMWMKFAREAVGKAKRGKND